MAAIDAIMGKKGSQASLAYRAKLYLGVLTWKAPMVLHKYPRMLCKEVPLGWFPSELL